LMKKIIYSTPRDVDLSLEDFLGNYDFFLRKLTLVGVSSSLWGDLLGESTLNSQFFFCLPPKSGILLPGRHGLVLLIWLSSGVMLSLFVIIDATSVAILGFLDSAFVVPAPKFLCDFDFEALRAKTYFRFFLATFCSKPGSGVGTIEFRLDTFVILD
jgi:hypothetical protein